jgi:hypothetical protein
MDSGGECVGDSSRGTVKHYVCGRVCIVLSLHVTGFWDVTPHTLAQIYRRFGGTC